MPCFRSTISASIASLYAECSAVAAFFSPTTCASELRRPVVCVACALHIAAMPSSLSGASSTPRAILPASIMRLCASAAAPCAPGRPAAHSPSSATRASTARSRSAASRTSAALRASMPSRPHLLRSKCTGLGKVTQW